MLFVSLLISSKNIRMWRKESVWHVEQRESAPAVIRGVVFCDWASVYEARIKERSLSAAESLFVAWLVRSGSKKLVGWYQDLSLYFP